MGGAGNHRSRAHARSPNSRGYRKLRPQEFHAASASIIGDTLVRAGRPSKRVVEGKAGAGGGGHAELSASRALVRPRRMRPCSCPARAGRSMPVKCIGSALVHKWAKLLKYL